jgi:hypothetical protein
MVQRSKMQPIHAINERNKIVKEYILDLEKAIECLKDSNCLLFPYAQDEAVLSQISENNDRLKRLKDIIIKIEKD